MDPELTCTKFCYSEHQQQPFDPGTSFQLMKILCEIKMPIGRNADFTCIWRLGRCNPNRCTVSAKAGHVVCRQARFPLVYHPRLWIRHTTTTWYLWSKMCGCAPHRDTHGLTRQVWWPSPPQSGAEHLGTASTKDKRSRIKPVFYHVAKQGSILQCSVYP